MANYKLSRVAKDDLIRIHQFGVRKFGLTQADKYFDSFFEYFEIISKQPFSFESVDFIKKGYRRCVCGSDSIYYRINNDTVEIMTIIGKQDLSNIL
ncbi:type II toxin-antitoxin system RelE/ParE family toxin [Psychroflexus montanilacus]|uniref:type II toxin-antitoxin system RelE/ParE family toxin n=1 Tax=Psychroflexus montanilacus TaxID=2873598 RepID=UPI001CCB1CDA|nr:type II toxin-antitoxin system RelE/ParE family toxin [Psychroflexus montanilacus]MBZ9650478.1 type II toxin-antitoxin system RelE/ParE family toxin [Psychroflexus montanilacus]